MGEWIEHTICSKINSIYIFVTWLSFIFLNPYDSYDVESEIKWTIKVHWIFQIIKNVFAAGNSE